MFKMMKRIPEDLIKSLRNAKRVAVLTGAGASAESGVPTFREAQTGLWAEYRPEDLATPYAFEKNPWRVWKWYEWRRGLIENVMPNEGHYALAEMEKLLKAQSVDFTLITQNVDGLHQKAGNQNVIELHGNIERTKCAKCGKVAVRWQTTETPPPHCLQDNCGGLLRPDVVWFGESLPLDDLHQAMAAAQRCDVFLSIGTSALVQPAASLPTMALDAKAIVVEINPNPTPITERVTYALEGLSGHILPRLVAATWG